MQVAANRIPAMMKAGYDRFRQENGYADTRPIRLGFFAGAVLALAAMDADEVTIEKVIDHMGLSS